MRTQNNGVEINNILGDLLKSNMRREKWESGKKKSLKQSQPV